jgi:hypothetical protein
VAKKARRKPDEEEEYRTFKFPEFDEGKFLSHEFEQTGAAVVAVGLAVLLGAASFLIDRANLIFLPPVVAIAVIAFSPYLIQRIRPPKNPYTKGEWVGLLVTELFGWLGVWFLFLNVFHP